MLFALTQQFHHHGDLDDNTKSQILHAHRRLTEVLSDTLCGVVWTTLARDRWYVYKGDYEFFYDDGSPKSFKVLGVGEASKARQQS